VREFVCCGAAIQRVAETGFRIGDELREERRKTGYIWRVWFGLGGNWADLGPLNWVFNFLNRLG
jgi:hypothetical protein